MTDAIRVDALKKSYGSHEVLKGLSFQVKRGEIFALLGVNGAGKTTTLECIEGLRACGGGSVAVDGRVGIQLQSSSLPAYIRPMEAVRLFAKWNRAEIDGDMLDALGIGELGKNGTRTCLRGRSGGSTWPWPWSATRTSSFWTNPPPDWTWRAASPSTG